MPPQSSTYLYDGPRLQGAPPIEVMRVTSITSCFPKPALVQWAANQVAEAAWGHREQLAKAVDTSKDDALKWLKGRPNATRDRAATKGGDVHDYIEWMNLHPATEQTGSLTDAAQEAVSHFPGITGSSVQMIGAYAGAMSYLGWKPIMAEARVWNLDSTIPYAGTLDVLARQEPNPTPGLSSVIPGVGDHIVVDVKTSKGVYLEHSLQLSAYAKAKFATIGQVEVDLPKIDAAYILHLHPETLVNKRPWSIHKVPNLAAAFSIFMHLAWVARADKMQDLKPKQVDVP